MSNCFCRYTSFYKSIKKFFFPKSPVKTITNLRQVCLQVFFRNTAVRTSYYRFGIGNDPVNPGKKLSRSFGISKDDFVMRYVFGSCRLSIGSPPISTDCFQKVLAFFRFRSTPEPIQKILNSARRCIFYNLHMGKSRMLHSFTVSKKRHCTKDSAFSLASPSLLRSFGSEKRIIHFYQTCKAILGIPICHSFSNFMSHQPCGSLLFDIKKPLHLRYGYTDFIHRHVIDHPVPFHQRCPSTMENRSRYYTCLRSTILAVVKMPIRKVPRFFMSTLGANKPIRPSLRCNVLRACFVIRKFFLEFYQAALFILLGHFSSCPRIYIKAY